MKSLWLRSVGIIVERTEWAPRRVREWTGLSGWIMDGLVRLGPVTRQPGGACYGSGRETGRGSVCLRQKSGLLAP